MARALERVRVRRVVDLDAVEFNASWIPSIRRRSVGLPVAVGDLVVAANVGPPLRACPVVKQRWTRSGGRRGEESRVE